LIADALRAWAGADVGLQQAGSILAQPRPYPAGPLRRQDALAMIPPTTAAMVLRVTGAQLLTALENGVSRVELQDGRFPQVSGVRFTYDLERPPGARVLTAAVGGRLVVPTATYILATGHGVPYQANGHDVLREAEVLTPASDGPRLRRVLLHYLAAQGTVNPAVEGRALARSSGTAAAQAMPALPRALPRTGGPTPLAGGLVLGGVLLLAAGSALSPLAGRPRRPER
jgi:2',3'-cyclic-nucleotide 2'-phosphodiesterase (5'-nucleotidase family)